MALLKLSEFLATVRDKVIASSDLSNFCSTNFGKSCTFYTGWNQKDPPGENNCPFVSFTPNASNVGETASSHSHTMSIVCGVLDSTFEDINANGTSEMQGIFLLEDMTSIIYEEIRDLSNVQNWIADDVNIAFDSITMFPMHIGTMTITTNYDTIIGVDIGL